MHRPSLYQRFNNVQRHDAEEILKEYGKFLQWRVEGNDTLLDIGTGSGNVLMDFIYPLMPENFQQLVGSDISPKMIDYAQKAYSEFERIQFRQLDIGTEKLPSELHARFDHITSFYCLHWVQNQDTALRNIYQLLRPDGGDCLLVFLATNSIYDVYKTMSKTKKWQQYMQDVDSFTSPLHYSRDPEGEFSQLLQNAGFSTYNVEIRDQIYIYEGLDNLKNNIRAICPFLERMSSTLQDEFLSDLVEVIDSMRLRELDEDIADYKFITPYKLVIAYARKSANFIPKIMDDGRLIRGPN